MSRKKTEKRADPPKPKPAPPPQAATPQDNAAEPTAIVGIGASAGGLEAFTALLEALPKDTGLAFVYVQHLAPSHVSMLAAILQRTTPMAVAEVTDGLRIKANHVYVNPPGHSLIVQDGALRLVDHHSFRAIDSFFSSLADDQVHLAIGVVLSGTASDGTLGLEAIKAAGGITFAQDSSAQHDGMPRSAANSGCVDFVLSPAQIADELVSLSAHLAHATAGAVAPLNEFHQVLEVLQRETGVDFSQYKPNTLHRRIKRRMALLRFANPTDYAKHLRENAGEIEALYQDVLIGVTSFFRDPAAYEMLNEKVFPVLFKERSRNDPLRIWVLGCATGEESYSLAIALKEYATDVSSQVPITVYATDLNNSAIEKARAGIYPKSIAHDVSAERLRRFFVESVDGYRIVKSIRDICVFARQNVLTDPPFSRLDLISCRNVLIYMDATLQKKLLPVLHYALKPMGFLFLGPSESLGGHSDSFEVEDAKHKLFRKTSAATRIEALTLPLPASPKSGPHAAGRHDTRNERRPDMQRDAERVLISRYVPAGVLVDKAGEIQQFRGETGLFLAPAPGRATLNVLKMARDGLLVPLRSVLQRAIKEAAVVRQEDIRVKSNGGFQEITVTAIPVQVKRLHPQYWLIFEPVQKRPARAAANAAPPGRQAPPAEVRERDGQITQLTQELAATREYLQSVIEQQDAANEDLQAANEEVQSANEELQSINEELETSKEEIQSSNEELTTVNEELQNRNAELNQLNNDLNNLFGSVQMAIVMVWRDLRIRRFTPLAERLFNLISADIGRPISDIKLKIDVGDLPKLLGEVIDTDVVKELEVRDPDGRWYQLRVRPYKTFEKQIDGAVIMLVDIDAIKKNQEAVVRQAELLEHTTHAVFLHDEAGLIHYWNRGAEHLYGIPRDEAVGKLVRQLLPREPAARHLAKKALDETGQWRGELHYRREDTTIVVAAHQTLFEEHGRTLILETHHDVTEHKRLEETLRKRVEELALADKSKNDFLAMLAHELRNPLAPLRNAVQILKRSPTDAKINEQTRELIERQVHNMVRMVDDLLDAARLTRGRVELQLAPVELQGVIGRALDASRPAAEAAGLIITHLMPQSRVIVQGDSTRLEQVFSNLLSNAIKYTEHGGEITVTLVVNARRAGTSSSTGQREAVVRIRDNGIGIAPDMLPRVFDLFAQADRTLARTRGGLGIGLSIVRELVGLHHGEVSAHSAGANLGSEFVVRLPADAELALTSSETPSDTESAPDQPRVQLAEEQYRVLVVDDSADIAESTGTLLSLKGYAVRTATDGKTALSVASRFIPHVVLLDIGMPSLDGYEIARRLRATPKLRDVLLIAVSGYSADSDRKKAQDAGFDLHFTKPLNYDSFEALITKR